ncbi:MAG TPA: hypothetical protein VGR28_00650 [Candidatus Thermoplasmatota archaeon]|nr:hypothetical protein [Candidatus Thermoplasmatota archaeon]
MDSQQGAPETRNGLLSVDPHRGLALREDHTLPIVAAFGSGLPQQADVSGSGSPQRAGVTFDGIALGPGVYVDAADRPIRVRPELLPLVAERMGGVFLRDLHREDMGASVGVVRSARVEGAEVRFTGDVRLAPYVDIVREFWPHVRFSLGFRYDATQLKRNNDGTYDLPSDFVVDHVALVPQGQYPNARLVRLLNAARGLSTDSRKVPTMPEKEEPPVVAASEASRREMEQLREQRDEALRAAEASRRDAAAASEASRRELEQARADLGKARSDLARASADLDAAHKLAEAVRLELGQAKNRVAAEVMKLELAAGKDFDLDARKKELTGLELVALDRLRGELRLAAQEAAQAEQEAPPLATRAEPSLGKAEPKGLDLATLERLGFTDTLRLAFQQGVL